MAQKVSSLYGDVGVEDNASGPLKRISGMFDGLGQTVSSTGAAMRQFGGFMTAAVTGPILGAGAAAVGMAAKFDSTMANISAVTKQSGAELDGLANQLLDIGADSVAGPQAVAEAYYDIAGGVSDASVRMDTLKASIALAEAGQADLGASTKGMISIMNAYSFEAEKAGFVSDVFTATVGAGVGTMDEFVAAMSPLSGLAASVGISFDDMGAAAAYMTTKGMSASQAMTGYQASITALLNPNAEMTKALKKAGFESGSAAIQQYGLVGALIKVKAAMGGSDDAMAKALGSVEALRASTALTAEEFEIFEASFSKSIKGATESAQEMQLKSFNSQMARFTNNLSAFGIAIGRAVLPMLTQAVSGLSAFFDKLQEGNPALIPTIIAVGALVAAIGPLTAAIGFLLSPIGLLAAAAVGLAAAWQTNFLGIRDRLQPVFDWFGGALSGIVGFVQGFLADVQNIGLSGAIEKWFTAGVEWLRTNGPGVLKSAFDTAISFVSNIVEYVKANAPDVVAGVSAWIGGAINWLVNEGPKALSDAVSRMFAGLSSDNASTSEALRNRAMDSGLAGVASFADSLRDWFSEGLTWLTSEAGRLLSGALSAAFNFTADMSAWLAENAPNVVYGVSQWIGKAINWLVTEGPKMLGNALKTMFGGGGGGNMSVSEHLRDQAADTDLSMAFSGALETVKNLFMGVFGPEGAIVSMIEGLFGLEKGSIAGTLNDFFGEGGTVQTAFAEGEKWVQNLINKIGEIASGISSAFQNLFNEITTPFRKAMKFLGEQLVKIGQAGGPFAGLGSIGQNLIAASGIVENNGGPAAPTAVPGGGGGGGGASFGRAKGGIVSRNRPYTIFDQTGLPGRNREIFVPKTSGRIMPMQGVGAGAGQQTINFNITEATDAEATARAVVGHLRREGKIEQLPGRNLSWRTT